MDMTFHKIYTSRLAVYTAKREQSSSGRLIPFQKTLPNKKTRHPFGYRVFKDIASCAVSAFLKCMPQ